MTTWDGKSNEMDTSGAYEVCQDSRPRLAPPSEPECDRLCSRARCRTAINCAGTTACSVLRAGDKAVGENGAQLLSLKTQRGEHKDSSLASWAKPHRGPSADKITDARKVYRVLRLGP